MAHRVRILVVAACLAWLTGCGAEPSSSGVRAFSESPPTSEPSTTAAASPTTTTATVRAKDDRLHEPFVSEGWTPNARSLSAFRMDVAPDDLIPRMTAEEVVATAAAGGFASDGHRQAVRFGLFTGTTPGEDVQNQLYSVPVQREPAWVVLTYDLVLVSFGPAPPPGAQAAPQEQFGGYRLQFLRDRDGTPMAGVLETGGEAPPLR